MERVSNLKKMFSPFVLFVCFVVISMFFGLRAQKAFIVVPVHDAATMRFPSLPICGDESSTTSPILRKRFGD